MLEHITLTGGKLKYKEELLSYSATDDDFDEINDNVDTFRTFTNIPVKRNYLDKIIYRDYQELNK